MSETRIISSLFAALTAALTLSGCDAAWEGPAGRSRAEAPDARSSLDARSQTCFWDGATVHPGQWLECDHCVWRYCQCQPDGSWGKCRNDPPGGGACDWSNPDWSDPACSGGGRKPCDWTMPDWANPACQDTEIPGSGGKKCLDCHPGGAPQGQPPPHIHNWL